MKKTLTTLLLVAASLLCLLGATNPPNVSFRTEFGLYREIIVNTNGALISDKLQKFQDGILIHTFREINPQAGVTQRLFTAISQSDSVYHSAFTNTLSTNSTWSTNGTVDHDIKTSEWTEEECVHFLGSGVSGHSKITNANGTVKTVMCCINIKVWLSNIPGLMDLCSNYTKPSVSMAFMYNGYLGEQSRQWFPAAAAFLSPPRTNFNMSPLGKLPAVAFCNIPCPANEMWEFSGRTECWWCPEDTNSPCWYWGEIPEAGASFPTTNLWFMLRPEWGPRPTIRSSANGNTNAMEMYRTQDFQTWSYIGMRSPTNGYYYIQDPMPPTNHAFYIFAPVE